MQFKPRRLIVPVALVAAFLLYQAVMTRMETARIATPLPRAERAPSAPSQVDTAAMIDDVLRLSSAEFGGRLTGTDGNRKAQAMIADRYESLGLKPFGAGYAQAFSFTQYSIRGAFASGRHFKNVYPSATNYIGYLPGSLHPERYIVISAHYDHLGTRDGKLYPGADDNASGVAALLALASYFKIHPPLNSIVFAAFDGEEEGLRGAKAFMAALPFPREQLALNLNMDMVSHNDHDEIFVAGVRHTPALRPLVEQVAKRSTLKVFLGHDRSMLSAGDVEDWTDSSDQGPFHDAGVPFLYFGVEDHADYHAPSDTFEHINQIFFAKVADLLADTASTLDRNLDTVVDAKVVSK